METTTSAPSSIPHVEPATPSLKPLELSFPLPRTPHTTLHIHLTFMATSSLVFLSTTTPGDSSGGQSGGASLRPMGSFVYAMPDRTDSRSTISTNLYSSPGSIDYGTRTARILARRTNLPVYVGCNVDPVITGTTVEEEMEGFSMMVDAIMTKWQSGRA